MNYYLLDKDDFVTVRSAANCEHHWPMLHTGEFVVLIAEGMVSTQYIRCDSMEEAAAQISITLFSTVSQKFVVARYST